MNGNGVTLIGDRLRSVYILLNGVSNTLIQGFSIRGDGAILFENATRNSVRDITIEANQLMGGGPLIRFDEHSDYNTLQSLNIGGLPSFLIFSVSGADGLIIRDTNINCAPFERGGFGERSFSALLLVGGRDHYLQGNYIRNCSHIGIGLVGVTTAEV